MRGCPGIRFARRLPDDLYCHIKRVIAKERAIRRTREQIRRWRVRPSPENGHGAKDL